MKIPYQVIFREDWREKGTVIHFFREDYHAFEKAGIPVAIKPSPDAEHLIFRSSTILGLKTTPQIRGIFIRMISIISI